jgi:hypothetical protein
MKKLWNVWKSDDKMWCVQFSTGVARYATERRAREVAAFWTALHDRARRTGREDLALGLETFRAVEPAPAGRRKRGRPRKGGRV